MKTGSVIHLIVVCLLVAGFLSCGSLRLVQIKRSPVATYKDITSILVSQGIDPYTWGECESTKPIPFECELLRDVIEDKEIRKNDKWCGISHLIITVVIIFL